MYVKDEFMSPVPPLTPYLVVADARAAVEFYKTAFGATQDGEAHVMPGGEKIMHVRVIVNGAMIMLADDFSEMMNVPCMTPPALGGSPVTLALQVDDAQSFWDKAVSGGATVTMPLEGSVLGGPLWPVERSVWTQVVGVAGDPGDDGRGDAGVGAEDDGGERYFASGGVGKARES